mgnify:CR=1 FL=1
MGRLIDADAFERSVMCSDAEDMQDVIYALRDYPTAYDPEKVVKQLEELNKYNLNLADCMLDIQSHGLNRHFICLEDAIEIVKGGGVNGN